MSEESKTEERKFPGEKTVDGVHIVRTVGRDFRVEGNDVDGYVGVDPEYRTYANATDKPILTEQDEEKLADTGLLTDVEQMTVTWRGPEIAQAIADRKEEDDKSDDESDDEKSDDESDDEKSDDGSTGKSDEAKATAPVKSAPAKATPAKAVPPKTDK